MLVNDLYNILEKESGPSSVRASLGLNEEHVIFNGHFPGMPVLPGVCMIRMVQEIAELEKNVTLRLLSADNIKFLSVLSPGEVRVVTMSMEFALREDGYHVTAALFREAVTYFKFKGLFGVA